MIPREMLRAHPFSVQTWDAQSSGTVIKPIAEGALEKRWAELTGKRKPPRLDTPTGPTRSSKVTAHSAAAKKRGESLRHEAEGGKPTGHQAHNQHSTPKDGDGHRQG